MEKHVVYCKCGAKYLKDLTVRAISACPKCNVYCNIKSAQRKDWWLP